MQYARQTRVLPVAGEPSESAAAAERCGKTSRVQGGGGSVPNGYPSSWGGPFQNKPDWCPETWKREPGVDEST